MTSYWDYFTRTETDNFYGLCASVLAPYTIKSDAAAAATPANVALMIYAADQEVVPAAFLQWHQE